MAVNKFTFISPGIFISEIDESQNPVAPDEMGPVIIGRTTKGPAMRPVKVRSYEEYSSIFGDPHPGGLSEGDAWRSEVNHTGPTYAGYAAKAWLAAGTAPATIIRLLGEDYTGETTTTGWTTTTTTPTRVCSTNGGAFGLFTIDSGAVGTHNTGTLAAVFYVDNGSMLVLSGAVRGHEAGPASLSPTAAAGTLIKSTAKDNKFSFQLYHNGALAYNFGELDFNPDIDSTYIRKNMNTNAALTNSAIVDAGGLSSHENRYWLGETFERAISDNTDANTFQWGCILPLMSASVVGWHDRKNTWTNAQSGWYFSQDFGNNGAYNAPETCTNLFKFHALDYGAWANSNLKIAIEDIRAATTPTSPWGTFSVAVYRASTYDKRAKSEALEKFTQCSMDPQSKDYVATKVGDRYLTWSDANRIHTVNGEFENKSQYIRIEMNPALKLSVQPSALPFGVAGPLRSKGFSFIQFMSSGSSASGSNSTVASGSAALSSSAYLQPQSATPTICSTTWTKGFVTGGLQSQPFVHTSADFNTITSCTAMADGVTPAMATTGSHFMGVGNTGPAIYVGSGSATYVAGGGAIPLLPAYRSVPHYDFTGSWVFPASAQRSTSNDEGEGLGSKAYFGVHTAKSATSTIFDRGYGDYTIGLPFDSTISQRFINSNSTMPEHAEYQWVFSLDNISGSEAPYTHLSGSRTAGTSLTAVNNAYTSVLDEGLRQFWGPMFGGFDGMNIKEAEPFRNSGILGATRSSYPFNSLQRAIYTVEDAEAVEYNLMVAPGITNTSITNQMLSTCAERADSLAIIDLVGDFKPTTENTDDYASRLGSVSTTVTNIQTRDLNNSYGCAYYPWVQIKDTRSERLLMVPPSVIALGTFASSEAKSELWFAPAGFNRGGLSGPGAGAAGIPVVSVPERLTSAKRDDLYENNINPIAKFPAEGIVIFGQKTLQQTSSALDRINVRRLMIYVKKEISRIAATILFDQNNSVTWSRFTGQVEPFLGDIKARYGLTDFKVILDTTTTADLIDRNVMYAKIFLKPARSIEFIAIDFIITRTGASFAD